MGGRLRLFLMSRGYSPYRTPKSNWDTFVLWWDGREMASGLEWVAADAMIARQQMFREIMAGAPCTTTKS